MRCANRATGKVAGVLVYGPIVIENDFDILLEAESKTVAVKVVLPTVVGGLKSSQSSYPSSGQSATSLT